MSRHINSTRPAVVTGERSAGAATKLGIIGAGAMGAGIGQVAALKGLNVVIKELTPELADAGEARITKLLNGMVARGRLSAEEMQNVQSRLRVVHQYQDLADRDLVLEAAVEKMEIKRAIFAELDAVLSPEAVIASNTSALSIQEMGQATSRPDRVGGLHFFNPVHRMDLVEVIQSEATSTQTTEALMKLTKDLGKTPVVTSDSPGFFVNRVLFPYIGEAVRMVCEGARCERLDHEIRQFGMPMGPIELIDHVGLDVAWHVAETLQTVLPESEGLIRALGQMVARGWHGKKCGRGFYTYADGRRRGLNPDLNVVLASADYRRGPDGRSADHGRASGAFVDDGMNKAQRRMIYPMINETAWCLQERVVADAWMADLAMVLGTGFAPFRGGPVTLLEAIGVPNVLNNLRVLTARHGDRFKPAAWLADRRTDNPSLEHSQ